MQGKEELKTVEYSNEATYKLKESITKEDKIAILMREILKLANPNAEEEIMEKTPMRYAKALSEFTQG